MRLFYSILLTSLISFNTFSQEIGSTEKMVSNFFKLYKNETPAKALNFLFSSNKYIGSNEVTLIKERIKQYQELLGTYHGKELLTNRRIGRSVIVYSYIVKYDRQPLRFVFTFYKAKDKWKIFNFKINDDFINSIAKE